MAVYKITEEQLTAYVKEGLGDGEIAKKVGVSRRHIGYLRDVFELPNGKLSKPKIQPTKAAILYRRTAYSDPTDRNRSLSLSDANARFSAAMAASSHRARKSQAPQDVPSDPEATPKG